MSEYFSHPFRVVYSNVNQCYMVTLVRPNEPAHIVRILGKSLFESLDELVDWVKDADLKMDKDAHGRYLYRPLDRA